MKKTLLGKIHLIALGMALALPAAAQRHELGLTLGRLAPQERSAPAGRVESGAGTALQANYGLRLGGGDAAAVWFETHLLANTQRKVSTTVPGATRDYATLYVVPGVRVEFAPKARVRPWASAGFGYALYEHSELNQSGAPNQAPRHTTHGVVGFGGGVDVGVTSWLALRAEVRDFLSPSPAYGAGGLGRQHNVVAGGGFVLRFGR